MIAWKNRESGECGERELKHDGEAQAYYRGLRGQKVRVGMEATGHARWFERLLEECGIQLWVANPAQVRAAATRKQKTDKRDAELLLELLSDGRLGEDAHPHAHAGGAGCAAAGAASSPVGADADASDEPVASHRPE